MKKTLLSFSAALLLLSSCSGDDLGVPEVDPVVENPDPSIEIPDPSPSFILPKKRMSYENHICYSDQTIVYNGNKIVSLTDEHEIIRYTYTGDLITKIVHSRKYNGSTLTFDYTYANGKLIGCLEQSSVSDYYYRMSYVHNNNGKVSCEMFQIVVKTGVERSNGVVREYTLKDGNLQKKETFLGNKSSIVYEYDAKNNPFRNVLGYSLLFDDNMRVNNLVKTTTVAQFGGNSTRTFTNTYTENDFLKRQVGIYERGSTTFAGFVEYYY